MVNRQDPRGPLKRTGEGAQAFEELLKATVAHDGGGPGLPHRVCGRVEGDKGERPAEVWETGYLARVLLRARPSRGACCSTGVVTHYFATRPEAGRAAGP